MTLGRAVGAFALLGLVACSGARHRKIAGPPPEYEHPDEPATTDGGTSAATDGAVSAAPDAVWGPAR